jgi:hypothetical protein
MRLRLRHVLPLAGAIALGSALAAPAFAASASAGPTPGLIAKSDLHRVEPVRIELSTKPIRIEPPRTAPVRVEAPKTQPAPASTESRRPSPARTDLRTAAPAPAHTEIHSVKVNPISTQPVKIDGAGK